MKVKVFKVRISEEFQKSDESVISRFITGREIIKINTQLIKEEINYWSVLIFYNEKTVKITHDDQDKSKSNLNTIEQPSEEELVIYNKLKEWRSEKARELQLPPYMVFHNSHLMSIARYKPFNLADLEQITGLGESKIRRFGVEILEVLENA